MAKGGIRAAAAAVALVALLPVAVLTGCTDGHGAATHTPAAGRTEPGGRIRLPAAGAGFDYQLGGASAPPPGVSIVERDRTARPAGAGYDICYVNGFQTQPDASERFAAEHPGLLLHAGGPAGAPLADPGWPDEYLFDTSTASTRQSLAAIVAPWIRGCARDGYDAVEIDNLDSYTRSRGALSAADNLALAADYARIAHESGLAIAQKNTADQARTLAAEGYDFAVTESCAAFDECDAYAAAYPVVLDIEYTDELGASRFAAACARAGRTLTMIMRDHDLVASSDPAHVYRSCPAR